MTTAEVVAQTVTSALIIGFFVFAVWRVTR